MDKDAFALNIDGVKNLVNSGMNKVAQGNNSDEGVTGLPVDVLDLKMDDEKLLTLKETWENKSSPYIAKIKPKQEKNLVWYLGKENSQGEDDVVSSNLLFEAEETFIPQALSQNPEPVVFSDNTEEGKLASNDLKTMLQYHADILNLRRKLGVLVRHWSIYYTAILKHGYSEKINDITTEVRKPQNFILDPDGYINEYGDYVGDYLGERIECTADELIDLYPKHEAYIRIKTANKLGTSVVRTEWWTDDYCFITFGEVVLDKYKNPFFNYEEGLMPTYNHFATAKMPFTFLSVFSLQERPHDITNLIEQSIPNQKRINDREDQITRNLKHGNNSIAVSGDFFTSETARQAANALEDGDPVLVPSGNVDAAIKRIPANNLPNAIFEAQNNDKEALRSVFGTAGLSNVRQNEDTTARGMILNQSHDSSRIGGGIGDALEQVADNVFNWWMQLYCVFYDEPHYGAIMGTGRAVEYTTILKMNMTRRFVISVSPNSMQPKDEISEQNMAIELANTGWLDPLTLFKKLNYPDPTATAKAVTLWKTNPQQYMMTYFPEQTPVLPQGGMGNPPDMAQQGGSPPPTTGAPPASASLSQVPLQTQQTPQ